MLATVIVFASEIVPPAVAMPAALLMVTPDRKSPLVLAADAVCPPEPIDPPVNPAVEPSQVVRRMVEPVVKTLEQMLELLVVDSTVKPVPKTTALAVVGPAENDAPVIATLPERPATDMGRANLTKILNGPMVALVEVVEAKA